MQSLRRAVMVLVVLSLALLGALPAAAQAPTLPAGVVLRLAGDTPGHIFIGTWCGVYELGNFGTRWVERPGMRDIPSRELVHLAGDALLSSPAGWHPGGVYRGAPGESWQRVLEPLELPFTASRDGRRAYAATFTPTTGATILRSDDGGRGWTEAGVAGGGGPGDLVAGVDPATGRDVLLLAMRPTSRGQFSSFLRSFDGGKTWERHPGFTEAISMAGNPSLFLDEAGTTVYLSMETFDFEQSAREQRLYRAGVVGLAFERMALPREVVREGLVDVVSFDSTTLVAAPTGIFVSRSGGTPGSYTRYDQGLGGSKIHDLLYVSGVGGALLYAATSTGVYQRDRSQAEWYPTAPGLLPVCTGPGRTVYDPIPAFADREGNRYFPETQHSLSNAFLSFWQVGGGLPVFGYPLSEEFDEVNFDLRRAFTTQYLERERFEFHPENAGTPYTVLLGRLGDELLRARGRNWRLEDGTDNPFPATRCQAFDVGGERRSVCGPFLSYWRSQGLNLDGRPGFTQSESLALFGLPLTAPRMETNPDGDQVLTQWFERARFEYHPNNPEPYQVLLGRLGAEVLKERGVVAPGK